MILEDTRQQDGKHDNIERWMVAHGVDFAPRAAALPFGDYMLDGSNISVDTKQDLQEVAGNLGRDHARFVRECERARAEGYRLVILIEQRGYGSVADVAGWTNRVCVRCQHRKWRRCDPSTSKGCVAKRCKPMTGATLAKIMAKVEEDHGVRFEFCAPTSTARRICEILGVEYERRAATVGSGTGGAEVRQ